MAKKRMFMKRVMPVLAFVVLSLFLMSACAKKETPLSAPIQDEKLKEIENQPTPPIPDVEKVIENITKTAPPIEVKAECTDVQVGFAALNGHNFCMLNQTGFETFRFGISNTGTISVTELGIKLYGQQGTSAETSIGEVELGPTITKKLSVYYSSSSHGKLWKVEITPRVISADGKTLVECTNAVIIVDSSLMPDKEIAFC